MACIIRVVELPMITTPTFTTRTPLSSCKVPLRQLLISIIIGKLYTRELYLLLVCSFYEYKEKYLQWEYLHPTGIICFVVCLCLHSLVIELDYAKAIISSKTFCSIHNNMKEAYVWKIVTKPVPELEKIFPWKVQNINNTFLFTKL